MTKRYILTAAALLAITGASGPAFGVTFYWATIGNPGNANDDTGYGRVEYSYQISKHEVTAGQYTQFLNAVAASDPHGLYNTYMASHNYGCKIFRSGADGSYTYDVASDWEDRPVNYVTYFDAMRFTNWLDNGQPTGAPGPGTTEDGVYSISDGVSEVRDSDATYFIPSEDEWYKAAYHKNDGVTGNYWDYPTSSDTAPINMVEEPDPGNNANFYDYYWTGTSTFTIDSPYYRTEVGEFENSDSPYGTFDQGGNVIEWNETLLGTGSSRGVRGGSFNSADDGLHAAWGRYYYSPANESGNLGFRVAMVPEPGSADFDNDGGVDGLDFLAWQRGESPDPLSRSDLALWESQYGDTVSKTAANAAVPEPTTCTLALAAFLLVLNQVKADSNIGVFAWLLCWRTESISHA